MLSFLSVAWTALWQLDYGYYQRLLHGTVTTLLALEKDLDEVKLSTKIEGAFSTRFHGHFFFYVFIQAALLTALAFAAHAPWTKAGYSCRWFWISCGLLASWVTAMVVVSWPPPSKPLPNQQQQ